MLGITGSTIVQEPGVNPAPAANKGPWRVQTMAQSDDSKPNEGYIGAIRETRRTFSCALKESKEFVDRIAPMVRRDWVRVRPTVMVCGHGRCGSSLVMQMLHAGGYPCFGEGPGFEPEEVSFDRDPVTLLPLIDGKAAKILDPQRTEWPDLMNARVIWLDRDRTEQAKSQVKFLCQVAGIDVPQGTAKRFSQSYGPDTARAMGAFWDIGILPLRVRFESILMFRYEEARRIADHVGGNLDIEAMAGVVIGRHPACRPDIAIELHLIDQWQRRR